MSQHEPHVHRMVPRETANKSPGSTGSKPSSPTAAKSKGIDAANLLQNASSIQSMLKNITETGGVGHSVQPQHQISSSRPGKTPKIAPRPRIGSRNFSPSLPSRHQDSRHGSGRSMPALPDYALPSPPLGREFQSQRPFPFQEPTRSASVEGYQSFTTTQSSYVAHNLSNRHPLVHNARHQNRGQIQRVRPQSPFAYPTRLKRPGYRPSSPALSLSRSIRSGDVERGNGSRTASPASMYSVNKIPAPWQQVVNRSDPTLRYYPPVQGVTSSRGSTPKPASSVASVSNSVRLSQVAVRYPGAWPVSPTATPPPLFYDYSEAFEEQSGQAEQTRVHRISVSIITSPVSRVDDGQIRYWESSQNTESEFLVELPSGNLPAPVVQLNVIGADNSRLHLVNDHQLDDGDFSRVQQSQPIEIPDSSLPDFQIAVSSSSSSKTTEEKVEDCLTPSVHTGLASLKDKEEQDPKAVDGDELEKPDIPEPLRSTIGPQLSEQSESSPKASEYSVQSSTRSEVLEDSTEPTSEANTTDANLDKAPRTPANQTPSVEYVNQPPQSRDTTTSKTSSSVESLKTKFPEIVAPTPERSIVSLSNRERFSKILGLNQSIHELDGRSTSPHLQGSSLSYARDLDFGNNETIQRYLSPTPASRNKIVEEYEASDDDAQLTYDLIDVCGSSKGDDYENPVGTSSSLTLPPALNSSTQISSSQESPVAEIPAPKNLRLSRRRIVINAGQTIEAKDEDFYTSPTIAKAVVEDTNVGLSRREMQLSFDSNALTNASTPPLSFKAFAPPRKALPSELPFAFTPLIQASSEEESSTDLTAPISGRSEDQESLRGVFKTSPLILDGDIERASTASPAASRPWNLDASYPWEDKEPPKLDVVMPLRQSGSLQSGEKVPKFRLRVHRASSSTASKLTKRNRSSEDTTSSVIASSVDLLKSASFKRMQKSRPSIGPGECNSSHDSIRTSPMQTRFIESFEQPSLASPVTSLMPRSPTLDVRSFFSDDSSQGRPKGSLRKRFSDFRTRNTRANSVDHPPGYDRGILSAAFGLSRASGRTSRQSLTTTVATSHGSSTRLSRWSIFTRLRSWFSRRGDDIRQWKRKRNAGAQVDNPVLHAGV